MATVEVIDDDVFTRLQVQLRLVYRHHLFCIISPQDTDLSFGIIDFWNEVNHDLPGELHAFNQFINKLIGCNIALKLAFPDGPAACLVRLCAKACVKDPRGGFDVITGYLDISDQCTARLARRLPKWLLTLVKVEQQHRIIGSHQVTITVLMSLDHCRSRHQWLLGL